MTNEILIALIAKDANELNRIFSGCDAACLTLPYMQMAADKAKEMTANIETLVSQLTAEPAPDAGATPSAPAISADDLNSQINAAVESVVSENLLGTLKSGVAAEMAAYITSLTEREAALRAEIAEANRALYAHTQTLRTELTEALQRSAGSVSTLTDDIAALKELAVSAFIAKPRAVEAPAAGPAQEHKAEPAQEQAHAQTNIVETTETEQPEVAPEPEMVKDEPLPEHPQPEPQPIPEQPVAPLVDKHNDTQEPEKEPDATHEESQTQPVVNIADSVVAKTTLAESIHTRESILDKLSHRGDNSLASSLSNKKIDDLKSAISIADRFRFQRELFGGDGERMNKTISIFNSYGTMAEAEDYIAKNLNWSLENPTVADFLHLLQRRYL